MLVEEFRGGVDVVVGAAVGAADDHDGVALGGGGGGVVDAVVVHGGLQEVGIFLKPGSIFFWLVGLVDVLIFHNGEDKRCGGGVYKVLR